MSHQREDELSTSVYIPPVLEKKFGEEVEDGPRKCKCGKADSGFCPECNRECPACKSKMYNGVCVYCNGLDLSHL